MIGFVCGTSILFSDMFVGKLKVGVPPELFFALLAVIGLCLYVLSWYLSVIFYKKREL